MSSCSGDIYGIVQTLPGVENFEVWIGMCGSLNDTRVLRRCGQHAPIEIIETDSILTTPDSNVTDRCWNVGQTIEDPYVTNISNPSEGIIQNYGQATCSSGNRTQIDVTVVIKPGSCKGTAVQSTVTGGNFEILKYCSGKDARLQIDVESSVLCERNIEWRLSARKTTINCTKTNTEKLQCSMSPRTDSTSLDAYSPRVYRDRFQIVKRFSNDSSLVTQMSIGEDSRAPSAFIVDTHNVCNLSIFYVYPQAAPERVLINKTTTLVVNACDNTGRDATVTIVVASVISVVTVITIISAALVYRFVIKRSKGDHNTGKEGKNRKAGNAMHKGSSALSDREKQKLLLDNCVHSDNQGYGSASSRNGDGNIDVEEMRTLQLCDED